ncbi:ABC transporter ATP-binding protein [Methanobacterium alcaliphilum]|uniref:ABC transporter ATP-binding protein n=1 Tax=Methanobacterium alcaliphilum TaxID=392018 RepID=UPI00200B5AF8|nr:ABC transporter ATP-binding protein [Methanobacterium alcaliphilum]MCK9151883.1 ABC transporter ATP-binding protein [Methanobacterium alcaliphilum]
MSILEIKNATFSYDDVENTFEDINLSVDKGDVVCILGPNGCGKTTLIKCLNKLLDLKDGAVYIHGEDVKNIDQRRIAQNIGYIPQSHVSTFAFSVLDVVLMGRAPHLDFLESPTEEDYEIAEAALEKFGINDIKEKPYTSLSGGEQQLVFFARVITQQPNILILDEPTSHLDFGNQLKTLDVISKLASDGLSVIMTSHYPDHAFISSNKVAIMKDRNFLDIGTPDDIITRENMEKVYGINVKIVDVGDNRKVCVPLKSVEDS